MTDNILLLNTIAALQKDAHEAADFIQTLIDNPAHTTEGRLIMTKIKETIETQSMLIRLMTEHSMLLEDGLAELTDKINQK